MLRGRCTKALLPVVAAAVVGNAFVGIVVFLAPLGLLQASVAADRTSSLALGTHTARVIGYDLPWTYRLWQLDEAP